MKTIVTLVSAIIFSCTLASAQSETGLQAGDKTSKYTTNSTTDPFVLNPDLTYGTVTDVDGNIYKTITIGTQTWMAENLKTTHYNDTTTAILNITDEAAWAALTTPAYCWFNNDAVANKATYGALYNWYAANNSKLCPVGWHVPTDDECTTLTTYLGGVSVAGGKLKETGTAHWATPNTGADNSSGFTALPGGSHYSNGLFYLNGQYGWYWSSTESSSTEAWHVYMQNSTTATTRKSAAKNLGFSIRCIKN